MLSTYGINGFIRNYVQLCQICVYGRFNFGKGVHFLHQFKHRKCVRTIKKKIRKSIKPCAKLVESVSKVYMRDTIGSILNILRYSTWDSAQEQLGKLPVKWDSYTINQVLKTHPPMEKSWLFFNWTSHLKGFKHDQFTYTTMLDIFGEAGRIASMMYVFQKMQEKGIKIDTVTYTSLLHWLSKSGDIEGSLKMWEEMKFKGCHPTVVSYTAFMKILFDSNRPKEATEVYKEMLESGCSPNCYTYTVLMEYLAGIGKFKAVLEILSKMQETGVQPDKATCNILIHKCCNAGETSVMKEILLYMRENSLVLRHPVYMEALKILKNIGETADLLKEVNPHVSFEDINKEKPKSKAAISDVHSIIDRGIILNLLERRNFVAIEYLINEMINKNIPLDSELASTIIQVNCENHRLSGALLAFKYSVKMSVHIDRVSYLSLIGLFIRVGSFPVVMEVIEQMIKAGVPFGTYLVSLLIYRFGSAQMADSAAKIFYSLPDDQNLATYTALMGAYFSSGDVDKGLEIYRIMKRRGIHASSGTYEVLLVGLKEAGRVYDAETCKKEMKSLQLGQQFRGVVSLEETLCDLLFAGTVVP
ncbi:PREDICTED: pentatricopeptide repeat-containing protein At2g01390 [Nelumbo nucifera]|uniref:Pentatricopeptide repeat-containing protein At2g01390 n=2 Tax=Nelumbo nucifera TaxID=4432 RepID=A0A1U7Z1R2_NELNU|nr:PREDICTED: pentatricopeptide repeat-containing protein At2g01390 [Nelumbo nucifera]DAD21756.1 TPA_asm: hypothetical protein HUJ06_023219 [Nelumbo nucifera]